MAASMPIVFATAFSGQYFTGNASSPAGESYLELLNIGRRMLSPSDVEFQTIAGVYAPAIRTADLGTAEHIFATCHINRLLLLSPVLNRGCQV